MLLLHYICTIISNVFHIIIFHLILKANGIDDAIDGSRDFIDYAQLLLSSKTTDRRMDFERSSVITTTLLDVVSTTPANIITSSYYLRQRMQARKLNVSTVSYKNLYSYVL